MSWLVAACVCALALSASAQVVRDVAGGVAARGDVQGQLFSAASDHPIAADSTTTLVPASSLGERRAVVQQVCITPLADGGGRLRFGNGRHFEVASNAEGTPGALPGNSVCQAFYPGLLVPAGADVVCEGIAPAGAAHCSVSGTLVDAP